LTCGFFSSLVFCEANQSDQQATVPGRQARSDSAPDAPLHLDDWPHLRGPNYDAVSTTVRLADAWPPEGPPVLWTRELGQGYSSFVVSHDKAFTQYQTLAGQYVVCLDAHTGTVVWEHRYDWPWQPASVYPGPYATPTWHGGRIYFAAPNGLVGCLDASTGQPYWSVNVIKRFRGRGTEFGYACTPLVENDKVIVPVGGDNASVVALRAEDGSLVWKSGDDQSSYCPAYRISFQNKHLVVAFLRNALAAFDIETGRLVWRRDLSNDYDEHSAWPVYAEPYLLICSPFRSGGQLFRLESTEKGTTVKPVWASRELSNDIFSSVLYEGSIYGFDITDFQAKTHRPSRGQFKCLDLRSGKVNWATDRIGHATVLVSDGKLVLFNDSGTLILASASPRAYEELGRVRVFTDGLCWTQPALWRGRLFVRNQSRAACIFLGTLDTLDSEQRQRALTIADIPHASSFDWTRLLGYEREYPFDAPTRGELTLWYLFGLVSLGTAAALTWLFSAIVGSHRLRRACPGLFWSTTFLVGLFGSSLFSHLCGTLVFTWPASLFAAFQLTLLAIVPRAGQPSTKTSRWISRLAVLVFVALCGGYYELCKRVGLVTGWGFLFGFLPGFPFAVVIARIQVRRASVWRQAVMTLAAFSVYFWGSGLFTLWKLGSTW
jgi:outer membrane protein assembly factor BamB